MKLRRKDRLEAWSGWKERWGAVEEAGEERRLSARKRGQAERACDPR
jgi:hypothetical protein